MSVMDILREARRVSTPTLLWQTTDWQAAEKRAAAFRMPDETPESVAVIHYDVATGHRPFDSQSRISVQECRKLGDQDDTAMAPMNALKKMDALSPGTMVFMVFPTNEILQDPGVAQAISNLRDKFKTDRRTLILLGGRDLQAPPLIAEDVPVLREELPNDAEIRDVIDRMYVSTNEKRKEMGEKPLVPDKENISKAVTLCRGLTRFIAEDGVARKMKTAGIDLEGLLELQKTMVESSSGRALCFEREKWTFDDVGGLKQFKKFLVGLFGGPQPPKLIVRVDEIDKSVSAASAGKVADSSGTSQDQLKVMLTSMEENGWSGVILLGSPGSGKTMVTVCAGNTFGCRTLVMDLGATKDSLVGAPERKIRATMDIIKAIGGRDVIFMATANRLDTMPPELQRRYSLGTWFFSPPSLEECQTILRLQAKRYGIRLEKQKIPDMGGWVGSDIRNCCNLAFMMNKPLVEAAEMITLAGKSARADIERISTLAQDSGFLCANHGGPYMKARGVEKSGRQVTV